ncbi:MAG: hypothetical protein GX781_01820 [Clostridiales bacterium]|nr:hypothetical protein [Clostridiales bacterium]
MNKMTLSIPAKPEWQLVLRSALNGVGVLAKMSVDMIDDLRSAADEAFNLLTHQSHLIQHIELVCEIEEEVLSVHLSVERAFSTQHCVPVDAEVAHLIIGSFVTNVRLEGDSCGIYSVHMKLPAGKE